MANRGNFRLYDFQALAFHGPVESRVAADKRKSRVTKGKRGTLINWYRTKVHPVRVEANSETLTPEYSLMVHRWRARLFPALEKGEQSTERGDQNRSK